MKAMPRWTSSTILATAMFVSEPAFAQQQAEPSGGLEEIIVTAQRREEPLQKVPIAVSALSQAQLETHGIDNIQSLVGKLPSVSGQTGSQSVVFIRGIGITGGFPNENSVAVYVDDVYNGLAGMSLADFNNIAQLVVLKGPQGTLFGRNATAGVIQITTEDPQQKPAFDVGIGYANYDTARSSFYGTTGLTDKLAVNLSALYSKQADGWGDNVVTGDDTYRKRNLSLRTKFLYTPTDRTQIRISGDYAAQRSNQNAFSPGPGNINIRRGLLPPGLGPYDLAVFPGNALNFDTGGGSVKINQELGFADLVSISAFRTISELYSVNLSGGPFTKFSQASRLKGEQITQEVQLLSKADSELKWQVGTFYLHSDPRYSPTTQFGPGITGTSRLKQKGTQKNNSLSVYEQTTYPIFEETNITQGLRYTHESQKLVNASNLLYNGHYDVYPVQSSSFSKFTWRLAVDQQLAPDVMAYVSYNRGIKSGGFNITSPTAPGFKPEQLDAYEIGLKTQMFDRRMRLNLATFYYDYSNIQVVSVTNTGLSLTNNAAAARMYGLDLDTEIAVTKDFRISGNLGLLNSEYTNFKNAVTFTSAGALLGGAQGYDATGNRTPFAPKVTANLTAEYTIESRIGAFHLTADMNYYGGADATPSPLVTLPPYTMFNSAVQWTSPSGALDARLWGANLTDKRSLSFVNPLQTFGLVEVPGPPRTFGVGLTYHYGR